MSKVDHAGSWDTFPVRKRNGWDRGLKVEASGHGMIGHAGAVLLHRTADRTGLVAALRGVLRSSPWLLDRANALVGLVVAIAFGGGQPAAGRSVGPAPCRAGRGRGLGLHAVADARRDRPGHPAPTCQDPREGRATVWDLAACREQGFPWLTILGRRLVGWVVLDVDATIITASSRKQGAAGTYKGSFGFHPLAAWCANTLECLAMLLRPGNAGSNTASDHISVLTDALAQVPRPCRRKILIRLDGAGARHALIEHLISLSTTRRTVYFTSGFTITTAEERAIALLPEDAWLPALEQDGRCDPHAEVAELTGVWQRTGWPTGLRFIARRVKPSRRHAKALTDFEKSTGWRYQLTVTNIERLDRAVPGSHHIQFLDILHRQHAVVEDRVRTNKATGLRMLPFHGFERNAAWVLAANLAADLTAHLQLLGLHGQASSAEPDTLRAMILHIPARLITHARARVLKIEHSWPWAATVVEAWQRLGALPAPT